MPKRTHEDAERTKQAILESALRLFSRRGYESTSLSDIARFAGVTRGAIYWHFKDKGQILVELCEYLDSDKGFHDLLKQASDPSEPQPLQKIKEWLRECGTDSSIVFYSSALFNLVAKIMSGAVGTDDVRANLKAMFDRRRVLLVKAVSNAVKHEQLPSDCNIELAAEILEVFLGGFIDHLRLGRAESVRQNYSRVVDGLMNAISRQQLKI